MDKKPLILVVPFNFDIERITTYAYKLGPHCKGHKDRVPI